MGLKPSLREVLTRLQAEGALPPEAEARAATALEAHWRAKAATPWYVRGLIGFSAWVAAWFLLFFFALLVQAEEASAFIVLGLLLCGVSTALRRSSSHIFRSQLALVFCLTGQGLLLAGVGMASRSETVIALCALGLELVLLLLYPDVVLRFIATVGACVALLVLVAQPRMLALVDLTLVGLAALLQLVFLHQARLQRGRWSRLVSPVGFALAVTLFGALLARSFEDLGQEFRANGTDSPTAVLTLGLALVTLYTALRVLREAGLEPFGAAGTTVFAALGLTALLTLHTPGVIAAAGVLALAFHRRGVVLLGLAVAFLLAFGVLYYYELELSLLAKSLALLGSGLVLLGLRLVLVRRFSAAPTEGT